MNPNYARNFGGGPGMGGYGGPEMMGMGIFEQIYRCNSIAMMQGPERAQVNHGGKIILPPSALGRLSKLNIEYPMLFELQNKANTAKVTHAGVLEFIAEEGKAYIPAWMLKTLGLEEGGLLIVKSTSLALGKFVKIQPQNPIFLEISDPKAVLEQSFRNFACLTQGDIITILYNDTLYEILVMETKPVSASTGISIIETDLEVDFAPPLGYVEPDYKSLATSGSGKGVKGAAGFSSTSIKEHVVEEKTAAFQAFVGSGTRLSGKVQAVAASACAASGSGSASSSTYGHVRLEGVKPTDNGEGSAPAALRLPLGRLYFGYPVKPLKKEGDGDSAEKETFTGSGKTLRAAKKGK